MLLGNGFSGSIGNSVLEIDRVSSTTCVDLESELSAAMALQPVRDDMSRCFQHWDHWDAIGSITGIWSFKKIDGIDRLRGLW